jgi:phage shock protein PspC (stress-responsive transcriptional regulator)
MSSGRLILDRSRAPGRFAREFAERARLRWYESLTDSDEPWNEHAKETWGEFRRTEQGALAEETVGRFLHLLTRLDSRITVYHSVEFRGPGLPYGDLDHLVVVEELSFAIAIETKYRLYDDEMGAHLERITELAAAVEQVQGWWTYPALCEAAPAIREDEEPTGRYFEDGVLVTDARNIGMAIDCILADFETFGEGEFIFPEHREPVRYSLPKEARAASRLEKRLRLARPREGRQVAGVCVALGNYFGVDPLLVRVFFVLAAFPAGIGIPTYAICWLGLPDEERLLRKYSKR